MTLSTNVPFGGYQFPSFQVTLPSPATSTAPYYIAYYDASAPAWQIGFSGPASVNGSTLTFPAVSTPFSLLQGYPSYLAFYQATGSGGLPPPSPAPNTDLVLNSTGYFDGSNYGTRPNGGSYEYSEDVGLIFNYAGSTGQAQLNMSNFSYSISPSTTSSVSGFAGGLGWTVQLTFRKVPGVVYTITINPSTSSTSGVALSTPRLFQIVTQATPPSPAPARSTRSSPFYYGMLHTTDDIGTISSDPELPLDASAGVRYLRTDWDGAEIEPSQGTFDFTYADAFLQALAAKGMSELPDIVQFSAPNWANGNQPFPAIWTDPNAFAAYAGAIAAHLAANFPSVTRVELFNEPNLSGSWQESNSQYAAQDGSGAAPFMKAAYAAIKSAAPNITVVGPELANGGSLASDPRTFLSGLYANGCKTGTCWDVLSVHNLCYRLPLYCSSQYTRSSIPERFDIYKDLQAIATQNGDAAPGGGPVHVLLSEFGYSIDPADPLGYDPTVVASYVGSAINTISADPTVDGFVYLKMVQSTSDFFGYAGLANSSGTPLPAYYTFQNFAAY